jgi:hypothetical protein
LNNLEQVLVILWHFERQFVMESVYKCSENYAQYGKHTTNALIRDFVAKFCIEI